MIRTTLVVAWVGAIAFFTLVHHALFGDFNPGLGALKIFLYGEVACAALAVLAAMCAGFVWHTTGQTLFSFILAASLLAIGLMWEAQLTFSAIAMMDATNVRNFFENHFWPLMIWAHLMFGIHVIFERKASRPVGT